MNILNYSKFIKHKKTKIICASLNRFIVFENQNSTTSFSIQITQILIMNKFKKKKRNARAVSLLLARCHARKNKKKVKKIQKIFSYFYQRCTEYFKFEQKKSWTIIPWTKLFLIKLYLNLHYLL